MKNVIFILMLAAPTIGTASSRVDFGCAPEVVDGNASAAMRIMIETSKKFPGNSTLRKEVQTLQKLNQREQIQSMMAYAGVDITKPSEVSQFLGEEIRTDYIYAVKTNLNLTTEEANDLEQRLVSQLKGQLK